MNPQEKILALWDVDQALHRLTGLINDLKLEEERIKARIQSEDQAWQRRRESHRKLRQTATAKAREVDETDDRIRAYQKRLDQDIIPYKEMEYLREQVGLLRKRLEKLEQEALELLEETDVDAERLSQDEKEYKARRARLEGELHGLKERREGLERERERLLERRQEALKELPGHLREHYERLHEAVSDPVAVVKDGACSGCQLRLSEILLERVREGREVVICENCSRFLFLCWR
ncbi:MAG: hypothetical protein XD60_1605 [Acetothermia bacterium 64_32]|nr:MAG: hypothetical protein XD60_1605 [Acetothermia bacterium 64_32]MBC7097931.1 hypothetical protein [Candidatus Bipolaricaulota bacterium]HAF71396.1 hypothetical protein [Candidatus Acetothermia bacterium]